MPTDEVLIQLATLAAHVQEMLAADHPLDKTPVGLTAAKNQRRRAMETILVLLADHGVRDYVSELERLGLVEVKR
jgi:citrate synthase